MTSHLAHSLSAGIHVLPHLGAEAGAELIEASEEVVVRQARRDLDLDAVPRVHLEAHRSFGGLGDVVESVETRHRDAADLTLVVHPFGHHRHQARTEVLIERAGVDVLRDLAQPGGAGDLRAHPAQPTLGLRHRHSARLGILGDPEPCVQARLQGLRRRHDRLRLHVLDQTLELRGALDVADADASGLERRGDRRGGGHVDGPVRALDAAEGASGDRGGPAASAPASDARSCAETEAAGPGGGRTTNEVDGVGDGVEHEAGDPCGLLAPSHLVTSITQASAADEREGGPFQDVYRAQAQNLGVAETGAAFEVAGLAQGGAQQLPMHEATRRIDRVEDIARRVLDEVGSDVPRQAEQSVEEAAAALGRRLPDGFGGRRALGEDRPLPGVASPKLLTEPSARAFRKRH